MLWIALSPKIAQKESAKGNFPFILLITNSPRKAIPRQSVASSERLLVFVVSEKACGGNGVKPR